MFWETIGEIVPLAFGIVISPMPIVAVIALLLGPKGKGNAVVFTLAFVIATFVLTLIFASGVKSTTSSDSSFTTLLHIVLGFVFAGLFFFLSWKSWNGRPQKGRAAAEPKWLAAIDSFNLVKSVGLGLLLAIINVKNLPIIIASGTAIGTARLAWPLVLIAVTAFALLACLGLIVPTVIGSSGSARVTQFLSSAKGALIAHNNIIMTVLFLILGAIQLGKAIGSF
ncbi:GAP family protein [Lysinibacter sp. HNR]|uniref:GAP family protein n=1 Tax=Lysinibacter sp. HNR TaxID=3031408 RepID=UPI002434E08D|nr:GAP family protein [Lysinibacter sp. HNR]WGD37641.1 GAP family protein [Lysinibacter sp. HNR]